MKYLFRGYIIAQIIIILIWIGLFILSFIIDNIMLCLAIMIVFSIACVILFYKVKKWYLKKNIQLCCLFYSSLASSSPEISATLIISSGKHFPC